MSLLRSVPLGAVGLLYAALLGATPSSNPPTPALMRASAATPWQDAVRAVWAASPQLQAAHAELQAAQARARAAAQPLYNPAITFDVENADVDRRTAGLGLTLDLSGKRRARSAQGEAGLQRSELDYELQRRDLAARWLKAWSASALSSRQRELGQRRLVLMQRFDSLAAQRLNVGDIGSPERDLAGLALGEAQLQQAGLISGEAAAKASLLALTGDAEIASPALPERLPPHERVAARPLDALPELQRAQAQLAERDASVQVAERARLPDPTISLTGGQVRAGSRTDRVIGLGVAIPLPVLNNGRAEVAAARAEADAAAASVQAERQRARAALQETQARYDALYQAAQAFRDGRAAAFEPRTALLEKLWRAGEISTSDYLVQLKQSLDTALSGLELESQAWQAWFDYLSAAGRLTDWIDDRNQDDVR